MRIGHMARRGILTKSVPRGGGGGGGGVGGEGGNKPRKMRDFKRECLPSL